MSGFLCPKPNEYDIRSVNPYYFTYETNVLQIELLRSVGIDALDGMV